jgi:hypothetical protein
MRLESRVKFTFPSFDREATLPGAAFTLWSELAAPPGDITLLPWSPSSRILWQDPVCASLYEEALNHRLAIFSPHPVDLSGSGGKPSRTFLEAARELPSTSVSAYRPIDWHRDFHSGHGWDPAAIYFKAQVAPRHGADIKVPWELSRFVHVGALARGDLERGGVEFILQVLDWIASNPKRAGINWTSTLNVAIRAINWIWGLRLFEPVVKRYPHALGTILKSLHDHGRHIERNLDYYVDLTDDHYIGDLAGLVHIGAAFPDFPEADRWVRFGLQELVSEMERQVFADGYCYMMSMGYHRFVAELFASAAAIAERLPARRSERLLAVDPRAHRVAPKLRPAAETPLNLQGTGRILPERFYERLTRMAEITVALTKPNGLTPQFGDNDSARAHRLFPRPDDDVRDHRHLAAFIGGLTGNAKLMAEGGKAAEEGLILTSGLPSVIRQRPSALPPETSTRFFPDAQIAVARRPPAYLAVVCGPNGLNGVGGHGHNDKLSFELNINGEDIIVDGGCPAYTGDPEMRNRFRATAAHSTLCVKGREQDPWPDGVNGLFQLPQRTRPRLWIEPGGAILGEHYGYGTPHRRRYTLSSEGLLIEDEFESDTERAIVFNLDPGVRSESPKSEARGRWDLQPPSGRVIVLEVEGCLSSASEEGCFSLGYGIPVPTRKLTFSLSAARVRTRIRWGL